jgi:transketolase
MTNSGLANMDIPSTSDLRRKAKLRLLQMHYESGVGHLGGNLSALDILLCLYHFILRKDDLFVLSKGHGAGALYVALWSIGALSDDDLRQFHKDGTRLPGHPPAAGIPEITFATGSLGHGLGLACGLALGKKLKGESGRVFCLTSDGEWNEGSCWESLTFLTHHKLDNLVLIVDCNGLQGFGTTREVANLEPLSEKFRAFGMDTLEIDGHALNDIHAAVTECQSGPLAIVARTIKGCGVSFMENRMEWHYLPLNARQYEQACNEVEQACVMSSADR